MSTTPDPDPRFDPRFQRGYDGPEPDAPATPALPSPIEPAGSPLAAAAVIGPPPSRGAEPGPPSREAVAHGAGPADGLAADSEDNPFWAPPRRNPYALALLLGGLAMIAVGVWLIWTVVTASSYPDVPDRAAQALSLVQQQLTPALMIAGFIGVVGWLVLGALAASARKRE